MKALFIQFSGKLISNYLKRELLAKGKQRKGKSETLHREARNFW